MTEIIGKVIFSRDGAYQTVDKMEALLKGVKLKLVSKTDIKKKVDDLFINTLNLCAKNVQIRVADLWENRIKSGEVSPELSSKTIYQKTYRNYAQPSYPLYATGEMSEGVDVGEVTETSFEIVCESNVNPSWHGASFYADNRNSYNPKREVISKEEFDTIIREEMENAKLQTMQGVKADKPEKLKSVNVNIAVNVTTTESAGGDRIKKKKKKTSPLPIIIGAKKNG